jgi:hypothetical protein
MKIHLPLFVGTIALSVCSVSAQDHGHLNIGAVGTNPGDQLIFDNGAIFDTNVNYVSTLNYTNAGRFAGYFNGNITLTVLAATPAHSGPEPNAPALGSYIFAQLVSVEGPPGGEFSFWDSGTTNPTITIASGQTGTNVFQISQNGGLPDTDPWGHIHNRRFTATKPGLYTVGFRAWDFSTNGPGGGSIHSPSEVLHIYFQAGVTITSLIKAADTATATFGATAGRTFVLEYSDALINSNGWTQTGDAIVGNDYFESLTDTNAAALHRLYRIKDVTP